MKWKKCCVTWTADGTTRPERRLHVHLLFSADLLQELKPVLKRQDSVSYHLCDLHDLAISRELASQPFSDAYFMQQLLRLRPRNVYAGAAERRWFFQGRLRAGVAATGFAMLLCSAGWSALNVYGGIVLYLGGRTAEEETHRYDAEYEVARKRLPETPVDASDLKTAVMLADSLAQNKTSPFGMVSVLGRSLHGFPAIRLNRMSWKVTGDPDTAYAREPAQTELPVAMDVSGRARSLYQAALLEGRIEPFNGDYRDAMDVINRFAQDLRVREGVYGVAIVDLPLDLSSGADLQGNTQSLQSQAEFTLRLVLKNEPEI